MDWCDAPQDDILITNARKPSPGVERRSSARFG